MSQVEIRLSLFEILEAASKGVMRQVQNLEKRRRQSNNHDPSRDWQDHINGALGECAVAKWLGIYWSGNLGCLQAADVGPLEVRTRSRPGYDLILHESDPDDRILILLTGLNGEYVIRGCILARDGKRREFWKDPAGGRPAFFVPPSERWDVECLINHRGGDDDGSTLFHVARAGGQSGVRDSAG